MNLAQKLINIAASGALALGLGINTARADLYDNFDSGSLDNDLWIEESASNINPNLTEEHEVRNGEYHTAQLTPEDKGTALILKNKLFSPGDFIDYDVNYISGEGNRISTISVDSNSVYTSLFGFWNTLSDGGVGNDFGKYHVNLNFLEDSILPEITTPNGEIKTTLTNIPYPVSGIENHRFGVVTRTGHNGTTHLDYDNFYINGIPEPSTGIIILSGLEALCLSSRKRKSQ